MTQKKLFDSIETGLGRGVGVANSSLADALTQSTNGQVTFNYSPTGWTAEGHIEPPTPAGPRDNEIWYTTVDGEPYDMQTAFSFLSGQTGAPVMLGIDSNEYDPGKGYCVIKFDGSVEKLGCPMDSEFEATEIWPSFLCISQFGVMGATAITSIVLPGCVEDTHLYSFYGCSNLTSVTLNDGLSFIDVQSFCTCPLLTSLTIPDSVTMVHGYAFVDCPGFPMVDGMRYVDDKVLLEIGNKTLTTYTLKPGTMTIGDEIFKNCTNLASITIPGSVTTIGYTTFAGCTSLASVTFEGEGVKVIDEQAFAGCTALQSITLPSALTAISKQCFSGCTSLASVTFKAGALREIGGNAFTGCAFTSITIPEGVTAITNSFTNCTSLEEVSLPESLVSLEPGAFGGCTSLPMEGGLRYADTCLALIGDSTLSSYSIKPGTRFLGCNFTYCTSMTTLTVPDGIKRVHKWFVTNCPGLTTVTLPSSLTALETTIIANCNSLATVNFLGSVAQWNDLDKTEPTFSGVPNLHQVTCNDGSVPV